MITYLEEAESGCPNTTVITDDRGILQITSHPRLVTQSSRVALGQSR